MTPKHNTRGKHIEDMEETIRKKAKQDLDDGYSTATFRAAKMATWLGLNERTLRRNGFPDHFDEYFSSCEWVKYQGLKVDLEEYLEELDESRN